MYRFICLFVLICLTNGHIFQARNQHDYLIFDNEDYENMHENFNPDTVISSNENIQDRLKRGIVYQPLFTHQEREARKERIREENEHNEEALDNESIEQNIRKKRGMVYQPLFKHKEREAKREQQRKKQAQESNNQNIRKKRTPQVYQPLFVYKEREEREKRIREENEYNEEALDNESIEQNIRKKRGMVYQPLFTHKEREARREQQRKEQAQESNNQNIRKKRTPHVYQPLFVHKEREARKHNQHHGHSQQGSHTYHQHTHQQHY